jgi:hypothetical protein
MHLPAHSPKHCGKGDKKNGTSQHHAVSFRNPKKEHNARPAELSKYHSEGVRIDACAHFMNIVLTQTGASQDPSGGWLVVVHQVQKIITPLQEAHYLGGKALLLASSNAVVGSLHAVGELRADAEGLEGDDLKERFVSGTTTTGFHTS